MSIIEQIIMISIAAVTTMATRFIPFFIFSDSKKTPKFVKQLGLFLPPAILGVLVIYCYKDVLLKVDSTMVISLIGGIITIVLHVWKRNMFLSIFGGTLCYMLLLNLL